MGDGVFLSLKRVVSGMEKGREAFPGKGHVKGLFGEAPFLFMNISFPKE